MPSEQQHAEYMRLLNDIHSAAKGRPNIDDTVLISATNPYVVDFKDRYHIFLWTGTGFTLTLEDLGTLSLSANTFTNISFRTGMKLYAQNQSAALPVLIRCTDQGSY